MKIAYVKINDKIATVEVVYLRGASYKEIPLTKCTISTSQLQAYCIINKIDKVYI